MSRFQTEESIGTWTEAVNSAVFKGLSGLTSSEAIELMKKGLSISTFKSHISEPLDNGPDNENRCPTNSN